MAFEFKKVQYDGRMVSVPKSPYVYRECKSGARELRFIRILAGHDVDDTVECEIFHDTLENVEYFAALSYEWGDPSLYGIILLDGIRVPVTLNLLAALRYLRDAKSPAMWIDALCINQEADHEKNSHITMMKEIYHEAGMVCVYLGPDADGSESVMRMLKSIDVSRLPYGTGEPKVPWTPSTSDLKTLRAEIMPFFKRSYWDRVWIIQEIARSSRLMVICGSLSVRWLAVQILLRSLLEPQDSNETDYDTMQFLHQMRVNQLQNVPMGLLQLLHSSRFAKSTNPRDRVYGLLGLSFDGDDFVDRPHYEWSEREICLDITKNMIRRRRSLDIFFARTCDSIDDLPSWCPNYFTQSKSLDRTWEQTATYITGSDYRLRRGQKTARWSATDNSVIDKRDLTFHKNDSLTVRGFCLGSIDGIGCTLSDDNDLKPSSTTTESQMQDKDDQKQDDVFASITRVLNMYTRPMHMAERSTRSSKPCITNSFHNSGAGRLYYHLWDFERYESCRHQLPTELDRIKEWRKRNKNFMVQGIGLKKRSHNFAASVQTGRVKEISIGVLAQAATYLTTTFTNSGFRYDEMPTGLLEAMFGLLDLIDEGLRLITIDSGNVGWAHPRAQQGDQVYLLQGCSMPIVLRPTTENVVNHSTHESLTYTIVGHALIDEAMDGTLWSELILKKPLQYITLR